MTVAVEPLPGTSIRAEAVCLALEPEPVLAFLHLPPAGPGKDNSVLICPPFGWDEMCSHRSRLRWAGGLAEGGYPAARIDLPGTGDSAGAPSDPGRLAAWTKAVGEGASWLRERTGTARVTAVGIGLGGIVVYQAVAAGAPIDDLILWAVPGTGRKLLHELRAYASMIAARHPDDTRPNPDCDGAVEMIGFLLDRDTAEQIRAFKVSELELPPSTDRRALLLGRDGLDVDTRLRDALEASGAEVTVGEGRDYQELMAHPQEARTPVQTIAASVDWLDLRPPGEPAGQPRTPSLERASLGLTWGTSPIRETPLYFDGDGGRLFGVLTEPRDGPRAEVCGLLLNAGALSHIGPNRIWVEVGRRWAARGVPTLRLDVHGIGEGEGDERGLVSLTALYADEVTEQTLAVLDQLAARGLPDRFVLGGLCSGAYTSLHAALADPRIAGILMINLYSFYWSEALVEEREPRVLLTAFRTHAWKRVLRRDVPAERVKSAVRNMGPRPLRSLSRRSVEDGQRERIEQALDRLRDQGTEALLLLSQSEVLHDQLVRQGFIDRLDRWPNLAIEQIPSRDHMFRALWLQNHVHESLDRALDRVLTAQRDD